MVDMQRIEEYARETVHSFAGVKIPPWLRFFDCRMSDDKEEFYTPWCERLFSSEPAEVLLGLKHGFSSYATMPSGMYAAHIDNRKLSEAELAETVREMIHAAKEVLKLYNTTSEQTVYFMPVAVALSNFGWCVIADKRKTNRAG